MNSDQTPIKAVATNIITGFLGVGKTSAILNLMQHKPADERWAVLVNEFGEIGVDGSLLQGQHRQQQGVFIREVPGGCMCCAAGVPMQIALNQLLAKARPSRLLIEPTGLGHPKEVLQVLSSAHYQDVLSLQKTLTLVDARNLSDSRYTSHDTFNQQIAIADTVIGNKLDLYQDEDKETLIDYVAKQGQAHANVLFSQHGEISLSVLTGPAAGFPVDSHSHHHHHDNNTKPLATDIPMPECGYIKAINKGEGFHSVGWRFAADKVFDYQQLLSFLTGLAVERMKAVFITDAGVIGFNLTGNALTQTLLDECMESRIEIISATLEESVETELLACELT